MTDRETGSINQNTYLQNFKFGPTVVQAQKGLGYQIYYFYYIKETLNTFLKGFWERKECASFVSRVLYQKSSLISSTSVIPWRILGSDVVEVVAFSSHQRYWWSKPLKVVLESQIGEFVVFYHKCWCLCCKGLIEKESMDSELVRDRVSKFYM